MKKDLEQIVKEIKDQYSYLRLSDIEYLELIKNACRYKNINKYIENIIKLIISNKVNDETPNFMKHKTKEEIISNYIDDFLSYSNNINDNLLQIGKVYFFYQLIDKEEQIINLNTTLFARNLKFRKIVENIRNNYDQITINDGILQLILDSYSYYYQDDSIEKDYYNLTDSFSIYLNDLRNLPPISNEEKEILLSKAKQGDEIARKKFISANAKLAIAVAQNYKKYCPGDFQDLVQSGNYGLINAFDKFDNTRGFQFSTYAFYWIRKEILNYIQNKYMIRIPSCKTLKVAKINKCKKWLDEHNIPITPESISKKTGYSVEEVNKILSLPLIVYSLDYPINEANEDSITYGDTIQSEYNLIQTVEDKIMSEQIYSLIEKMYNEKFLDEKDIEIILSYNGFKSKRETFDEIGNRLNISKQGVEQLYKKILKKIRFSEYKDEFAGFSKNEKWVKSK